MTEAYLDVYYPHMRTIIDIFLHLDTHLASVISQYGEWTYVLLLLVIFCETGLVITPFLPGDSLLFAAGAFAALGSLNVGTLLVTLIAAAVVGDSVNYWIGRKIGAKVLAEGRFFGIPIRREYIERTQRFYDKYGAKTIVIARFMPIVRTFAPFVAGIGSMHYKKFVMYNIFGGAVWVTLFVFGGYFFGNLPAVKHNFTLVILAIIILSTLPPVIEFLKHRKQSNRGFPPSRE